TSSGRARADWARRGPRAGTPAVLAVEVLAQIAGGKPVRVSATSFECPLVACLGEHLAKLRQTHVEERSRRRAVEELRVTKEDAGPAEGARYGVEEAVGGLGVEDGDRPCPPRIRRDRRDDAYGPFDDGVQRPHLLDLGPAVFHPAGRLNDLVPRDGEHVR